MGRDNAEDPLDLELNECGEDFGPEIYYLNEMICDHESSMNGRVPL